MEEILDVDLLAFEQGGESARRAVVDGVMRSLANGFVYTTTDLSENLLDEVYERLEMFFGLPIESKREAAAPGTHGQTGYTGLLVETAAMLDRPDWKEMLNWGDEIPLGHPLQVRFPANYPRRVLPEAQAPGISDILMEFHRRVLDVQRRFLRIIAVGIGCAEGFFDEMTTNGSHLTRAIHYPAMDLAPDDGHTWAGEHADINLITALPRATARGLQVKAGDPGEQTWIDVVAPEGHVIVNTGIMLERITNGLIPSGIHQVVADVDQPGDRYSVVQFCHPTPWTVLDPVPSCVGPDCPKRFAPIGAGDLLTQVLYDINLIEDARRV